MQKKISFLISLVFLGSSLLLSCSFNLNISSDPPNSTANQPSPLLITPIPQEIPGGDQVTITPSGGTPPYAFSVVSGGGSIDSNGVYTSPTYSSRPVLNVEDSNGQSEELNLKVVVLHYIGGNNGGSQNNVWSSHDGVTWVAQNNFPVNIQGFSLAALNDILYLIGGYTNMGVSQAYSTQDIGSWTADGNLPRSGEMAGRTVYNDKIWIGDLTVFVSTEDGSQFTTVGNMPLFPDQLAGSRLENFNDQFFLVAGTNWDQGIVTDNVWRSSDGTSWNSVSTLPSPRYAGALFEYKNKLWYAGGENIGPVSGSEVWQSSDGITWALAGNLPAARGHIRGVVFRDKMWVIGGDVNGTAQDTVWSSEDGNLWNTVGTLPSARYNGDVAVY